MLFGRKKQKKGLISEVDNSRQIVYDFRRRTHYIFESYRALSYKKVMAYDIEQMKEENAEVLEKLIAAQAVDAGNADCLLDRILAPVRKGILNLDAQALEHMDFYTRQGSRAVVDSKDIGRLIEFWREKEASIAKEHRRTEVLWNKYCGYEEEA